MLLYVVTFYVVNERFTVTVPQDAMVMLQELARRVPLVFEVVSVQDAPDAAYASQTR